MKYESKPNFKRNKGRANTIAQAKQLFQEE